MEKQPCSECGVAILPTTFRKTGGKCMPCFDGRRAEMVENATRYSPETRLEFAPNNEVEAHRPFVDEFWLKVLGTSYATSFVSNESTLESWEHYVGGRENLVERVLAAYGVDISAYYGEPIPLVLSKVRAGAA